MPRTAWIPDPIWRGEDAYIIGGGPSLRTFDWTLLHNRNTVGCNSAYLLGPDVCRVCFFGDQSFYVRFADELAQFPGLVVTSCRTLAGHNLPWLRVMHRKTRGLGIGGTLGWNFSSGASAINLALSMGAQRVFLLGMDLCGGVGNHNWHDRQPTQLGRHLYDRFLEGYGNVARDLPIVFPGREVISVSDGTRLTVFPVIPVGEHFGSQTHVTLSGAGVS